jgi:hypothetical protein
MEEDEEGETHVTGTKMKAEGETSHEPHVCGRMRPEFDTDGSFIIKVFFEKDRSGILSGRTIDWPNYSTIEPVVSYLTGTKQGSLGNPEETAEKDAAAQAQQEEAKTKERELLFKQIRSALEGSRTIDELKSAWDLTKGKKTKLADLYTQLETLKESRKAEMLQGAGV